ELDWIALAEESSPFRAVLVSFDDVLPVHNDRRMTGQADGSAFRALDMHAKEQRVQSRHMYRFFVSVPTRARDIQPALAKGILVQAKCGFAIRRILFADFGNFVEGQLQGNVTKLRDHTTRRWHANFGFPIVINCQSHDSPTGLG